MAKIEGKYKSVLAEELLEIMKKEDSRTKLHHLVLKYLYLRYKQVEKIIANIDDSDLDLELIIEQLWEDLELALNHYNQIDRTVNRSDYYAQSIKFLRNKNDYERKLFLAPYDLVKENKTGSIKYVINVSAYGDVILNNYVYRLNEISPLPLTKEFLEKNGWELHDDVFINKDENISNIIFSTSGKFILGGVFIIEYVHQLQQYLRLDGDIEFANNLKV